MTTSMPDDTLALQEKLRTALHGHTEYSRDTNLSGKWLTDQIWPFIMPLISRLEAAEARAVAAEAAYIDARHALGLALLADGLCDEIKARLKIAWLKVGGSKAPAALTANPKDTEGKQ